MDRFRLDDVKWVLVVEVIRIRVRIRVRVKVLRWVPWV